MRATRFSLGALLALGVTASPGFSQHYYPSAYPSAYPAAYPAAYQHPIQPASNAGWGGFCPACPDGGGYGPNLPSMPYQGPASPGMEFPGRRGGRRGGFGPSAGSAGPAGPAGPGGPAQVVPEFRYNPYVRGPRDFFMWGDMMEQQRALERRPVLVP